MGAKMKEFMFMGRARNQATQVASALHLDMELCMFGILAEHVMHNPVAIRSHM